jgi:hypothetical protein
MIITYDCDRIHATGQRMVENAGAAYDIFTPIKRLRIMPYLEQTPLEGDVRPLEMALRPHMDRIQAAFDWQLAMGNTLKHVADAIRQQELIIKGAIAGGEGQAVGASER